MIIHYNSTIGSFLLHFFLLIYHPYPPSFNLMIFILVPLIFILVPLIFLLETNLERQGARKHCSRMRISADRTPAE